MTKLKTNNLAVGLVVLAFIRLISADESPSINELPSKTKIGNTRELITTDIPLNLRKGDFKYEGGNPGIKERDQVKSIRKYYSKTNDDISHGDREITNKKYSSFSRNVNEKMVAKRQVRNYATPSLKAQKMVNDEGAFDFVDMPLSDQPFASDVKKMSKFSTKKGPNGQEYEYEYIYYYYDEDDQAAKPDSNIISNEKLDKIDSRYELINANAPTTNRTIPYSYMERTSSRNHQSQKGSSHNRSSDKAVSEPAYSSPTSATELYLMHNGYTTAQNKFNSSYLSTTGPNNSKNSNRPIPSSAEKFGKNKKSEFPVENYVFQQDVITPATYAENEESRRFASDQQYHKYHKSREGKSFSLSTTTPSNNQGVKPAKSRPSQQHSEASNSPRIATNIPKEKNSHIETQSLTSKSSSRKDTQEHVPLRAQNGNPPNLGNAFVTKNNKKISSKDSHNIDTQPKLTKSMINSKDGEVEREISKKIFNDATKPANNSSIEEKLENNSRTLQYSNDALAKQTSVLKENAILKIEKNETVSHFNAPLENKNDEKSTEKILSHQSTPTKLSTPKEDYFVSQKTQNEKNTYFGIPILTTTTISEKPKIAQYYAAPVYTTYADKAKTTQYYATTSTPITEKAKTTPYYATTTPTTPAPTTLIETTLYTTYATSTVQDNIAGTSTIPDGLSTIQENNTGQPTTMLDNIGYSTLHPDNINPSTTYGYGLTDKSAYDLYAIVRQSQQEESMNYIPTETIMYSTTMDADNQPLVAYSSTTQPASTTTPVPTTPSTTTLAPTTTQTVESTRPSFGSSKRYRGSGSIAKSRYPITHTSENPNYSEGDSPVKTKNRFHPTERPSSYTKRIQKKPKDVETSNATPKEFEVSKAAFVPKRYRSNLLKGENQSTTEVAILTHTPSLSKVNFAERYNARRRNNLRSTTSTANPSFSEENLVKTDDSNSTISETKPIEHSTTSFHPRTRIQPRPLRPGPKLNISQRGKPATPNPATLADSETSASDTVTPDLTDEGTKPSDETINNATTVSVSTTESTPIPDILTRLRKRTKFRITETPKTTPHLSIASANQNRRKFASNLLPRKPHSQRAEEHINQISEKMEDPKPTIISQTDESNTTVIINEKMDETVAKSEETVLSTSEAPATPQVISTTENKLSSLLSSRRKHLSARKPGSSVGKTST